MVSLGVTLNLPLKVAGPMTQLFVVLTIFAAGMMIVILSTPVADVKTAADEPAGLLEVRAVTPVTENLHPPNDVVVTEQKNPVGPFSSETLSVESELSDELFEVIVMVPGQSTVTVPPRLSVQLVVALLEKVILPEILVPSLLTVPVNSDVGHLRVTAVLKMGSLATNTVSVELAEILVLTGVALACAAGAATTSVASIATPIMSPRRVRRFM